MALNQTTIMLGEELERLRENHAELEDSDVDDEDTEAAVNALKHHLERKINGVGYLVEEYGEDATVTVGGLDMGDKALVSDKLEGHQETADAAGFGATGTRGTRDLYEAAAGLVGAPFLPDDINSPDSAAAHGDIVAALSNEYPQVTEWLVDRVREQTSLPDAVGNE